MNMRRRPHDIQQYSMSSGGMRAGVDGDRSCMEDPDLRERNHVSWRLKRVDGSTEDAFSARIPSKIGIRPMYLKTERKLPKIIQMRL